MALVDDVKRLSSLFSGIAAHVETVAEEYWKAYDKHGRALEDALTKEGYDRSWLRCLADVGDGVCLPMVLFLDPAKREIVRQVPKPTQRELIQEGVNGKALSHVSPPALRSFVTKSKPVVSRKVPVSAHARSYPERKSLPPVTFRPGVRLRGKRYEFREVTNAIVRAINEEGFPTDIAVELNAACERLLEARKVKG